MWYPARQNFAGGGSKMLVQYDIDTMPIVSCKDLMMAPTASLLSLDVLKSFSLKLLTYDK